MKIKGAFVDWTSQAEPNYCFLNLFPQCCVMLSETPSGKAVSMCFVECTNAGKP